MLIGAGSILAFTNMNTVEPDEDANCHVTITYAENGQTVVLDTSFFCNSTPYVQSIIDDLNLPKGTNITCSVVCEGSGGDLRKSGNFEFKGFSGMDHDKNIAIIKEIDEDGNEVMRVIVDGEELDLDGEHMIMMNHKEGEWSTEDGAQQMKVMMIKTEDGDGNVFVKKCIKSSKDCPAGGQMKCCSTPQPGCCSQSMKMMHSGEAGENIFVKVIDVDGEEKRCIVIVQSMNDNDESMLKREAPEAVPNLDKSELAISDLMFSPNPNNGHFNLSFELGENTPAKIAVYSMEGRKVYSKKIKQPEGVFSEDIDISKYGSGTYFLQITQGDKAQTKKVVIQ